MFKFAVITDTHIRAPDGDLSSPFPVNEKANARARYACQLIQAQTPDFTVHLGDMVHPLPHMNAYQDAVAEAHEIFKPLKPNLYFVPGNHDIGDKPSPGMPAKAASTESVSLYESSFGPGWQSFTHQGVLFVVINSSLVNSGTEQEAEQQSWLEQTLRDSNAKFVLASFAALPLA
ncbi:MAG: metallophosphoesterase, partial [Granulosicoccus sp.]|nr:metallophosphoesterase [Granulosicoccus sp.]